MAKANGKVVAAYWLPRPPLGCPDLCGPAHLADCCRGSWRALPVVGYEAVPMPRELEEDLLVGQAPIQDGSEAVPDPDVEQHVGGTLTL